METLTSRLSIAEGRYEGRVDPEFPEFLDGAQDVDGVGVMGDGDGTLKSSPFERGDWHTVAIGDAIFGPKIEATLRAARGHAGNWPASEGIKVVSVFPPKPCKATWNGVGYYPTPSNCSIHPDYHTYDTPLSKRYRWHNRS